MKKFLLLLLSALPLLCTAQQLENSLLWKITGNGLKEPSYLFGTFHITCDASLSNKVKKAMDNTTQLYLEIDMTDPSLMATMMKGSIMKNGVRMSQLASTEDYEAVKKYVFTNTGTMVTMIDNFKPAIVEMMVLPKMLKCPMQSVEQELIKVCKEQQEKVYGLETIEDQMAVFDAIPYQQQMDKLIEHAKEGIESQAGEFDKMIEVYKKEDLKAIMDLVKEENTTEEGAELLDKRNKKWIPKIEAAAKVTPTFFGVGAAHLPGENGVINLLRQKGYTVEAVKQ
ncbi:TraB/GumN family protein [Flavobacterium sp.]|uniref:TraB/GumN family protein n=1 Tax=Flavobacterium sp. TaxID=239 RepID=UPI002617AB04|nr:TraB/GumN family protein [Flavobacterium sp.]